MKSFNEHITAEKEDAIRLELTKSIKKSLSFEVLGFSIEGDSRSDIKTYINREEENRSYGFTFKLKLNSVKDVANQLLEIDKIMNNMFGNNTSRSNRVLGTSTYTETSPNNSTGDSALNGKDTRVRLPIVEYWYDPEIIENSEIFKTLSQMNKYKI